MTKKQFDIISAAAKKWCYKKGFVWIAEDVAQFCVMRKVIYPKSRVENNCVDYVRNQFGCSSNKNLNKANYNLKPVSFEETMIKAPAEVEVKDLEKVLSGLSRVERAHLKLKYAWGMSNAEIADCFGTSESTVVNTVNTAKDKAMISQA